MPIVLLILSVSGGSLYSSLCVIGSPIGIGLCIKGQKKNGVSKKGRVEFHSGRSDKENRQVMKTKRVTVNNPKGRKIHQGFVFSVLNIYKKVFVQRYYKDTNQNIFCSINNLFW